MTPTCSFSNWKIFHGEKIMMCTTKSNTVDWWNCPPACVNGPAIKCSKCKSICYLKCFGIEKCLTLDGSADIIKVAINKDVSFYAFLQHSAFVCCSDSLTTSEMKSQLKLPKTASRGTSKTRQSNETPDNVTILNEIKSMICEIEETTLSNSNDLSEIKKIANENNVIMKKSNDTVNECFTQLNTPTVAITCTYHWWTSFASNTKATTGKQR